MTKAVHAPLKATPRPTAPHPAVVIRPEHLGDAIARDRLLDATFGNGRKARTCERLREGRLPAQGLAFSAVRDGRLVGTVRLWHAAASGAAVLMLGPLAVDANARGLGIGAALMRHVIAEARRLGHSAIVLLGDAPYYAKFGFSADAAAKLALPGPFQRERLLALELKRGALIDASGVLRPTGAAAPGRTAHAPHPPAKFQTKRNARAA